MRAHPYDLGDRVYDENRREHDHKSGLVWPCRQPRRWGLSLIEVLVAITLLAVVGMGIIQVLRQSGASGEAFSAEHFTAMFLAQKVMEDINARVRENPHFFQQLVASATGDFQQVVNGKSLYFSLLENTTNFTNLLPGEDEPITSAQTVQFQQLERFSCRVASGFVADPVTGEAYTNLIEVEVRISWQDKQSTPKEYAIRQRLYGLNRDTLTKTEESKLTPFPDEGIAWALYEFTEPTFAGERTIDGFMAVNGGNRAVVTAMGALLYYTYLAEGTLLTYDGILDSLENRRNRYQGGHAGPGGKAEETVVQEEIASTYEQKASVLFLYAARTNNAIQTLAASGLTDADLGSKLSAIGDELRGRIWVALEHFLVVPMNFHGAETNYLDLLAEPLVSAFPQRRLTIIIRRLTDLRKLGVLFSQAENEDADGKLRQFRRGLLDFREQYLGREPHFVDYLDAELALTRNLPTLTASYGGSSGMVGMIERIVSNQDSLFAIEGKISGGGGPFTLPTTTPTLPEVPVTGL